MPEKPPEQEDGAALGSGSCVQLELGLGVRRPCSSQTRSGGEAQTTQLDHRVVVFLGTRTRTPSSKSKFNTNSIFRMTATPGGGARRKQLNSTTELWFSWELEPELRVRSPGSTQTRSRGRQPLPGGGAQITHLDHRVLVFRGTRTLNPVVVFPRNSNSNSGDRITCLTRSEVLVRQA